LKTTRANLRFPFFFRNLRVPFLGNSHLSRNSPLFLEQHAPFRGNDALIYFSLF
jgi:hypothetical protein